MGGLRPEVDEEKEVRFSHYYHAFLGLSCPLTRWEVVCSYELFFTSDG